MLALLCLLAAACQSVRQTDATVATVSIARDTTLLLPPAPDYEGRLEAVQTIVARYDARTVAFQATVNADAEQADIVMVALNGPRIMEVAWTREGIEETRFTYTPESLSGLNVLADIFLVFWPTEQVKTALPDTARLVMEEGRREIHDGANVIVRIEYDLTANSGRSYHELTNMDRGYSLKIYSQPG